MTFNIVEELKKQILVLDGAMGTLIQSCELSEVDFKGEQLKDSKVSLKGNNDILSITQPQIIKEIHCKYLSAGSNIIETNTLNSNRISQADYGTEEYVYEMNRRAAELAKEAVNESLLKNSSIPRFVAGSIGPTAKSTSISPDVLNPAYRAISFDELMKAYEEQICGLMDGGADVLLIETIIDGLNAKAALVAAQNVFDIKGCKLPIIVSATITDRSGRLLSGQSLDAFMLSMRNENVICMGLNCSFGTRELIPFIKQLSHKLDCFISIYPNAGFRNIMGEFEEKPHETAGLLAELVDGGFVNIVGGCCGTTPEHIEKIAGICAGKQPREIGDKIKNTVVCGLEPVVIDKINNFLNIGERTNVAGSKKFARLIAEEKYEEAVQIAREQVENGAQVIDINFDDAMLDSKKEMKYFLRLIAAEPEIAKVPIMIDSSDWEVIKAGLKSIQGKHIVNSISLKDGEEAFIKKAEYIKRFGAAVVVMAFDEQGQADNYTRKIEVCKRAYNILVKKVCFPPEDIIFDPNILAIGTGIEEHNNYAVDFIHAVKWIKQNLPYAKVSGGISNLSFAFRGNNNIREAIHAVFLFHAIAAGLDMGILNPSMSKLYGDIPEELLTSVENVVLNKIEDALEKLLEYSNTVKNDTVEQQGKQLEWRNRDAAERLVFSIVKGTTEYLERDIIDAIENSDSVLCIVEGPLMAGMREVGAQFGEGKLFLPQVLKSARVMKKAVEILNPYFEGQSNAVDKSANGRILLATVKGDVHDIGKNIVAVVLACNGFEVIDMGIMVHAEAIVSKAKEIKADIIGLSGLITPSLEEMHNVAELMDKEGLNIPLIIGGATTSSTYAAIKLDPIYKGAVIHVADASKSVEVCKQLLNEKTCIQFVNKVSSEYERIRYSYNNAAREYVSIEEARENAIKLDFSSDLVKPHFTGIRVLEDYSIKELRSYIDWTYLFTALEMGKRFPDILEDERYGTEAKKVLQEANEILDELEQSKSITLNGVFGIFPVNSSGDDIIVFEDEERNQERCRLNFLRRQVKSDNNVYPCLSDYVAPIESGIKDYVGAFTVTAGIGVAELSKSYEDEGEVFRATLVKLIADRLAEAFAERLHEKVRTEYWCCDKQDGTKGIRPAIGYPAIPDHSEKLKLQELLNFIETTGVDLTESYMMCPAASVCGLYFMHPKARYFDVGRIDKDQLSDYVSRKDIDKNESKRIMPNRLID